MFYDRFVFDGESMDRVASDICTPKLLKYLEKQYDYDCLEAPCYAIWCFRTDMQDGNTRWTKWFAWNPMAF